MVKYAWRRGFRAPAGADAQEAGERLHQLMEDFGGQVQAEDVVDDARPASSPLHPHFEWDDSIAAEEHRKSQARTLLRAVVIIAPEREIDPEPQTCYIRDGSGGGAYFQTVEAMKVPELQERMLQQAYEELLAFKDKYQRLQTLASVIDIIDDILDGWRAA